MLEHTEQTVEKKINCYINAGEEGSCKSHIMLLISPLLCAQLTGTNKRKSHAHSRQLVNSPGAHLKKACTQQLIALGKKTVQRATPTRILN